MSKLIIDPRSGIAGDMFIAALIHAGAPRQEIINAMKLTAELLGKADIQVKDIERRGTAGIQLKLSYTPNEETVVVAKLFEMLKKALDENNIDEVYQEYARRVLLILSEAEVRAHLVIDHDHMHEHGHVHGHDNPDSDDHIHEDGHTYNHDHNAAMLHEAQDILVDIVGSSYALQALNIDLHGIICLSPVYYGGGSITFSHGTFSVPAPAVKEIIHAFDIPAEEGPVSMELLTPTGAAILSSLGCHWEKRQETDKEKYDSCKMGIGLGTHEFAETVNVNNSLVIHCQ